MKFCFKIFIFFFIGIPTLYAQKPNILWLTLEDTSPQFIGCYGNNQAKTPNIDAIAKEGVRFINAFSTGTVCAPSRFTLITGVRTYEAGTGHHRSAYPIPDFIKGFPSYLRKAGYYTTNKSKTDYNTADAKRLVEESWHESSEKAGWWNRKPGQPFFAVVNFMQSHQSMTMTNPYQHYKANIWDKIPNPERIGENDFALPPFYRDSPAMRKQFARVYNSLKLTDILIGEVLNRLKKDKLMDSTIIFIFGDHGEGMPRGKTNAIGLGYRVPFIIWFPPMYRHLSPWGNGVVTEEMVNFEDLAPTLLNLAGVPAPDYLKGRALVGPQPKPSPDLLYLSTDRSDEGQDMVRSVTNGRYLYSRNFMPFIPEMRWIKYQEISDIKKEMRLDYETGKLNAVQKKLFQARPMEYLYDLHQDTWELNNLVNDPKMQPLLIKMRQAIEKNILDSKDILFLPEYDIAAISKTITPYEYRQQAKNFPIREIYAAASLSGQIGSDITQKQITLLQNKNKIIRYWATIGLQSQEPDLVKPYRKQLTAALQDAYPPVQITAAALLYGLFKDPAAQKVLEKYAPDKNQILSLLVLQNIAYLTNVKPFATVIQQVYKNPEVQDNYDLHSAAAMLMARLGLREMVL